MMLERSVIHYNTGKAFIVRKKEVVQVRGESTADFVVFNLENIRERFDSERTKVDNNRIFLSKGDHLYSKSNNIMMTIVDDTFRGHHDLQHGMCSRRVYQEIMKMKYKKFGSKAFAKSYNPNKFPTHGCWENLTEALKPWGIPSEDIPSPFNIFQDMEIDMKTGIMKYTNIFPSPGSHVDLRSEMNCLLVGISGCPYFGLGKPLHIQIYRES